MEYGCFADKVIRYKGDDFQRLHGLREEILNYDSWRGAHNHVFYGVSCNLTTNLDVTF